MRVYLPTTLTGLARAHQAGVHHCPEGVSAHGVTPALREWYTEGDAEELEYAALLDAAGSSLRVLASDPSAPRRRVVLAAEVPDHQVTAGPGQPSAVRLAEGVPLRLVVSIHVDDGDAVADVAAAVEALDAADAGDDDARFLVDGADGHDLLWYDVTELASLL